MLGYLVGGLLTILGVGTLILRLMRGSIAESLLQNQDTKAKVIDIQTGVEKDAGQLVAEQAKRDQMAADLKAKENANVTKDELLDFVNKPTDSNK